MLAKDQTLGKYQILDRLGSGGFGSVYLALDTWINRKVAIKVPHQQEEEVIEMLKEPRIMSELKNLNIAEMITAERTNGIFFMVLEYIEGESLDKMIRREKKLLPELALD
ncbi:MAG: serine/threonine protein kinase, partial [Holophagaceae bacterium]